MQTISYSIKKEIPLLHEADVIVVGGGPGGTGAAIMAARHGVRTLLIERYGYLGGMATSGEVHPFMPNEVNGACLDRPVYTDWIIAMQKYLSVGQASGRGCQKEKISADDRMISKEIAMLAAEDLCLEAGVQLLYHHSLVDVIKTGTTIDSLVLSSKSGYTAARAKIYVDTTGDADLAAMAGCKFEMGGQSGHCQPMTLCFKLSHVDVRRTPDRETLTRLYREAKERGEIDCPREDVLVFEWFQPDVIHFNTTRIIKRNGTSGIELSDAEIEGRRQMRQLMAFLKHHIPGYAQAQLHSVGHHIGVRETRRVRGLKYLTREAFDRCAKFPDGIARVHYPIDIHNPEGTGSEMIHMPEGEWYEIPYGCIVAQDIGNLLMGGRPISVDHAIHSSMRVMPVACSIGQAAGLAAALAALRETLPSKLAGMEVRQMLIAQGAFL